MEILRDTQSQVSPDLFGGILSVNCRHQLRQVEEQHSASLRRLHALESDAQLSTGSMNQADSLRKQVSRPSIPHSTLSPAA